MNEETAPEQWMRDEAYPLQKHLGFVMVAWSKNYSRFDLPMQEYLGNRYGIPHGGVFATLADTAMGYCGCFTGDPEHPRMAMTLSLNVNYLAQMKGKTIIAEGFCTGGGRKTFFADAKITDDEGILIATASGVFRYRTGG
ncbi:MAG: PaaI family thioesterase [Rhizobiaceae bacterium]|nr:PaaI family thioesterase [Rhizobiaceae bacterium]